MTDIDLVTDDEGYALGYECLVCETIVTTEAKARTHCIGPDSTDTDPVLNDDRCDHQNPIDVSDVTDEERARMLLSYLDVLYAEFALTPKLMPLDNEGKGPIIQQDEDKGRDGIALDSPEADALLVDGYEAARRIHHDGARVRDLRRPVRPRDRRRRVRRSR